MYINCRFPCLEKYIPIPVVLEAFVRLPHASVRICTSHRADKLFDVFVNRLRTVRTRVIFHPLSLHLPSGRFSNTHISPLHLDDVWSAVSRFKASLLPSVTLAYVITVSITSSSTPTAPSTDAPRPSPAPIKWFAEIAIPVSDVSPSEARINLSKRFPGPITQSRCWQYSPFSSPVDAHSFCCPIDFCRALTTLFAFLICCHPVVSLWIPARYSQLLVIAVVRVVFRFDKQFPCFPRLLYVCESTSHAADPSGPSSGLSLGPSTSRSSL